MKIKVRREEGGRRMPVGLPVHSQIVHATLLPRNLGNLESGDRDRWPHHSRISRRILDASDWNRCTDLQHGLSLHLRPGTHLRPVDVRARALGLANRNLLGLSLGNVLRTAGTSHNNQRNNDPPQTERHQSAPPRFLYELALTDT